MRPQYGQQWLMASRGGPTVLNLAATCTLQRGCAAFLPSPVLLCQPGLENKRMRRAARVRKMCALVPP